MNHRSTWLAFIAPFVVSLASVSIADGILFLSAVQETEAKTNVEKRSVPTVKGRVVDEAGAGVSQAIVIAESYGRRSKTNADAKGNFKLTMPEGRVAALMIRASSQDGKSQGVEWISNNSLSPSSVEDLEIALKKALSIEVHVVDAKGNPLERADVGIIENYQSIEIVKSDRLGRAQFLIPAGLKSTFLYAKASGYGVDYCVLSPQKKSGDSNSPPSSFSGNPESPIQLILDGANEFKIKVVDQNDQPVVGIDVYPWLIKKTSEQDQLNMSGAPRVFSTTTDMEGFAEFDWLPKWNEPRIIQFGVSSDDFIGKSVNYNPKTAPSRELTLRVAALVPVAGQVMTSTGRPAKFLPIRMHGSSHGDSHAAEFTTDAEGRFELKAAPNTAYLAFTNDKNWKFAPEIASFKVLNDPVDDLRFTVSKGIRVFGRVTVGKNKKPIVKQLVTLTQNSGYIKIPIPGETREYGANPGIMHRAETDELGEFEFTVGAGSFWSRGSSVVEIVKFDLSDETEKELNFHSDRPEKGKLTGFVIDSDGNRIANAEISCVYASDQANGYPKAKTGDDGQFELERTLHKCYVRARSSDGKLQGLVILGPDDLEAEIKLTDSVEVVGRLLDANTGDPLLGKTLLYGVRVYNGKEGKSSFSTPFGGEAKTDVHGYFKLSNLISGQKFNVSLVTKFDDDGMYRSFSSIATVNPEPGQTMIELGDVEYKERVPYKPPTLEERITKAFAVDGTLDDRLGVAINRAKLTKQRVLVLLADPKSRSLEQFAKLQYDDNEIRKLFFGFVPISVNTTLDEANRYNEAIKKWKLDPTTIGKTFQIAAIDTNGQLISDISSDSLMHPTNGEIVREKLIRFLTDTTPTPYDGQKLLDDALARAKAESKKVIIQETATWCGPCIKFSEFMDSTRFFWSKDYVWLKMDHRWTGALEIMKEKRKGAEGGIPWHAILDSDGKVLITSNDEDGENIGFPSSETGIAHLKRMFEKTATRLTDEQIDKWVGRLRQ